MYKVLRSVFLSPSEQASPFWMPSGRLACSITFEYLELLTMKSAFEPLAEISSLELCHGVADSTEGQP